MPDTAPKARKIVEALTKLHEEAENLFLSADVGSHEEDVWADMDEALEEALTKVRKLAKKLTRKEKNHG